MDCRSVRYPLGSTTVWPLTESDTCQAEMKMTHVDTGLSGSFNIRVHYSLTTHSCQVDPWGPLSGHSQLDSCQVEIQMMHVHRDLPGTVRHPSGGLQVCQVPLGVCHCLAAHRVGQLSDGNKNDTCDNRSVQFL